MNILILEDEQAAAKRLMQLLRETAPEATIVQALETVREAVDWLNNNPTPDLILSDIQLGDGIAFDIFEQVHLTTPVIFTTAFDAYMLRAFKVNSIDYLLKPIDKDELIAALEKYRSLHEHKGIDQQLASLLKSLPPSNASFKSRFLIKLGEKLLTVPTEEVAYIRADDKIVFLHTTTGQKYIVNDTLDELEKMLDPSKFFRLNRSYIAPIASIEKINNHFNGRLKIQLLRSDDPDIFVSRERAALFKTWLDK